MDLFLKGILFATQIHKRSKMFKSQQLTLLFTLFLFTFSSAHSQGTKLLRFPDIHGDQVVFCYAGDIWKASSKGGVATRLTAHAGQEIFPKFSPDGNWIAFTGQYDGDEQVYIIPAKGGLPRQLTYYPAAGPLPPRWGYDHQVYGWSKDGKKVLFRSTRDNNTGSTNSSLYTVSVEGGLPERLPMPDAGAGDFGPNSDQLVYSPLFRDFRHWKRYEGGWAQDLYIFDIKTSQTTPVSKTKRTERDPMWIGGSIYFTSDRSGTLNLYQYNVSNQEVSQITDSKEWDVRWPSSDDKEQVVYELGGELVVLNLGSNNSQKITIEVPDDGLSMRPSRYSAAKNIESADLSPKGERALFVARGDVFTAPIENGSTRNLTNSTGSHDRGALWSPDGKTIAYISDKSGEDQIYLIDQLGKSPEVELTQPLKMEFGNLRWSPKSDQLLFSTAKGSLYLVTVSGKVLEKIDESEFGSYGGFGDYTWSPDGKYLAYSKPNEVQTGYQNFRSIFIYSIAEKKLRKITSDNFHEFEPVWDPDGEFLFYFSDRQFSPQISGIEWNFATNRSTGIYGVALKKSGKNPFAPESDEVEVQEKSSIDAKGKKKGKASGSTATDSDLKVDFDGMASRAFRVPVQAGNFYNLQARKGKLFYLESGAGFYGRSSYMENVLKCFDLKMKKEQVVLEGLGGYTLSYDGKKFLTSSGGKYLLYDAVPNTKSKKVISTGGLMVDRVPSEEWKNIFWEVWRRYRDLFYVENMHGYDWKAIGDRYSLLLDHVAHRSDLNYVIAEMIAELNVGHAYIVGGDFENPKRPRVALPGAQFELDSETKRYRIKKIYAGENEEPKYRSPLTELGVNAKASDYILAIDGEELKGDDNPYRLLQHKTDPVTLTLSSSPSLSGSREVQYVPLRSEGNLRYKEWTDSRRKMVDELSGGKIGYLHIPNMGSSGIYEFIKWYYPQLRKQGLVVDDRNNGGGNVSQMIIERLDSKLLGTRFDYAGNNPQTYPYTVFHGHMVCLINGTSASDGDIFPHRFRKAGLGKLIGKRTWGGVVGYSGTRRLIDGGSVVVPMFATNDIDGSYIIEGVGVEPDIDVDNDPASVIAGKDPQLEMGVREVLKLIETNPKTLPKRPADPVKTE